MCRATSASRTIDATIGVNDAIFVVTWKSLALLASASGRLGRRRAIGHQQKDDGPALLDWRDVPKQHSPPPLAANP
jgi:hypothetical protein